MGHETRLTAGRWPASALHVEAGFSSIRGKWAQSRPRDKEWHRWSITLIMRPEPEASEVLLFLCAGSRNTSTQWWRWASSEWLKTQDGHRATLTMPP